MSEPSGTTSPVIDVNMLRRTAIKAHGLIHADRAYWLYYDETNNIRRLHLQADAFNVPDLNCWVLGGLGRRDSTPIDVAPLRARAFIQPNAEELHFALFGRGEFPKVLGSRKLETFLDWALKEDLLVHYLALDPFYWSVVDVVDSVLAAGEMPDGFGETLKSDLCTVLRDDRARTAALMARFDYPDLKPENRHAFMTELIAFAEDHAGLLDHFGYQMLRGLLQMGRHHPLPFIEGGEARVLIDGFRDFFLERICILKNASHIFDAEDVVSGELARMTLTDGDAPFCNYRFVERSHDDPGVQVSDVMVGFLAKFFSWISSVDEHEVRDLKAALSPTQARNRERLIGLLEASYAENAAFTHTVVSLADRQKAAIFLDF
ncbi:hypothetical protein ABE444_09395 [Brevundimonas pondensis]|uniref:hypothetical protein n=1 Tax=Brevundimonas pondensis TaxID=2774189 RepID=UPI0015FF0E02|nr:hypothetical protein [Pseudomonas sp. FW305-3-2-15-E-TSA4]